MDKGHSDLHELPLGKMLSTCKSPYKVQTFEVIKIRHAQLVPIKMEKWGPDLLFFVFNNSNYIYTYSMYMYSVYSIYIYIHIYTHIVCVCVYIYTQWFSDIE